MSTHAATKVAPKVTKAIIKAVRSGKIAPLSAYLEGGGPPNWKINGGNDTLLIMVCHILLKCRPCPYIARGHWMWDDFYSQ